MDPMQAILDRHARELLPTFVRIFIFVYILIALSHVIILPDHLMVELTALAVVAVAVGIGINFAIESEIVLAKAELILVALIGLMTVNSLAHLYLATDIRQTTNIIFVMAVTGYVFPGYRPFYFTLALITTAWLGIVFIGAIPEQEIIHFGFEILLGLMFAVFLHTVRRNQLKQFDDLEQTVEKLDQSQEQLSAGEALMQSLMDSIPAGIIVRDTKTRILFMNKIAKELLDMNDRDVTGLAMGEDGMKLYDVNRNPVPRDRTAVARVQQGEVVSNEIFGVKHEDGTFVWGLVNSFKLTLDQGDVFITAFVNITEQVTAEMLLHESELRAYTILDSVIEAVVAVNANREVTLFNPGACQLTGVTEGEALGASLDEVLDGYHEESKPGQIRQGYVTHRSGEKIAVELSVTQIEESGGWVYTFRDVREQLKNEQEQATADKMNSIGVLAGGIAHDFNNLLTAIYGNVALAENSIDDKEKALDFLRRSSESIQLATNLTKQLLTFSTSSEPIVEIIETDSLVREASEFALSGSSTVLSFDINSDLSSIEVDEGQMKQAIGNIVLNASQAMDKKGEIAITVDDGGCCGAPDFICICIRDTGPGIPVDNLEKIFDPYFTTKDTGTGLGLATTRSIVMKHGGSVSVETGEGTGTMFKLLVPKAGVSTHREAIGDSSDDLGSKVLTVLVMDDEEIVRQTVMKLLEHLGHTAQGAQDGEEAIERYKQAMAAGNHFDLAIMDLTIAGGMGGREAAAKILEIDPDAKLVMSSGYAADADMSHYEDLGFCGRLSKPFRSADLEQLLIEVVPGLR